MKQPKPKVGDIWEVKRPGKRKIVKEIGRIDTIWSQIKNKRIPYVNWRRMNKGRYSGITLKGLMEFGQRLSTKADRDIADKARWARQDAKRVNLEEQSPFI